MVARRSSRWGLGLLLVAVVVLPCFPVCVWLTRPNYNYGYNDDPYSYGTVIAIVSDFPIFVSLLIVTLENS